MKSDYSMIADVLCNPALFVRKDPENFWTKPRLSLGPERAVEQPEGNQP